jgi:hypothetical protein
MYSIVKLNFYPFFHSWKGISIIVAFLLIVTPPVSSQINHSHYRGMVGGTLGTLSASRDGHTGHTGNFATLRVKGSLTPQWLYAPQAKFWFSDYLEADFGFGNVKSLNLDGEIKNQLAFVGGFGVGFTAGYAINSDIDLGIRWMIVQASPFLLSFKENRISYGNTILVNSRLNHMFYPTVRYKKWSTTLGLGHRTVESNSLGLYEGISMRKAHTFILEAGYARNYEHQWYIRFERYKQNAFYDNVFNPVEVRYRTYILSIGYNWIFNG